MIGYSGFKGAGKTRAMVKDVYKAWLKNPDIVVFTNTPLTFGKHKKTGSELKQFLFDQINDLEPLFLLYRDYPEIALSNMTFCLFDEASVCMPSRFFTKIDEFMLPFLAQARHINVLMLYTTQHPSRVDKIIRELTEEIIFVKSLGNFLTITHTTLLDPGTCKPPQDAAVSMRMFFPKKYNVLYDTHYMVSMSSKLGSTNFEDTHKNTPIFNFCYNNLKVWNPDTESVVDTLRVFFKSPLKNEKFISSQIN